MISETRNAQVSPLLLLPGELRNHIYRHVFESLITSVFLLFSVYRWFLYKEPLKRRRFSLSAKESYFDTLTEDLCVYCGLIFGCRKLYSEVYLLLFRYSIVHIGYLHASRLPRLLHTTQLDAIRTVAIDYDAVDTDY